MSIKTLSALKSFFENGDKPTQDEFGHLIDTTVNTVVSINSAVTDQETNIQSQDGNFGLLLPGGSLITNLFVIVTEALSFDANKDVGLKLGTTQGATQILDDSDIIEAAAGGITSVAVGKGVAMDSSLNSTLGGTTAIIPAAGTVYYATSQRIHFQITSSSSSNLTGKVICGLQYVKLT